MKPAAIGRLIEENYTARAVTAAWARPVRLDCKTLIGLLAYRAATSGATLNSNLCLRQFIVLM
jgi:hypothetical protein